MPDGPPEIPVVLLLGEGDEQRQFEIVQPYVERQGYRIVIATRDIHAAVRMLEEGRAARVIVASRTYMPTPAFEIVTRDLPRLPPETGRCRQRRPRRLRRPEDPPTGR